MGRSAAMVVRAGAAAIAAALLFAAPVAAAPADVEMDGTVLRINATDSTDHDITISRAGNVATVTSGAAPAPTTSDDPQCDVSGLDVNCTGANQLSLIVVRMGSGNDDVRMQGDPGAEANVELGDGSDFFVGSPRRSVVRAGGGADFLQEESASSVLDGGPGSDSITPGLGSDDVIGGPGLDLADYVERNAPLRLSLDGLANDGDPTVGERDNLLDMEFIRGGDGNDDIRGDDDFNEFEGNEGNDRLDGGGGFDRLLGGEGNDDLRARDGLAERVECGTGADRALTDDIDAAAGCESVDHSPDLQPDRDGDGVTRPADCADLDATIRPGAFDRPGNGIDEDCRDGDAVDLDRDRDGFSVPLDCDDGNRSVRPGAGERLGNFVDEDCDDVAEPFPRITATMLLTTRPLGRITEMVGLIIADLDGGERIVVTCRGPGCRFERKRARARRGADRAQLDRFVKGMRLRPGARLRATVTRADRVKRVLTATMRAGTTPKRAARCIAPPRRKVAGC